MIIGKSLTAIGGGGLKPEIRVTAKAGALLNLHYKDSSIILQSYQMGSEETRHTFVVNVSETTYVVEDATNSASVEVLVDAVAVFDVGIQYRLYLYKDGDECADITGGYDEGKYAYSSSYSCKGTWTKNADTLSASKPGYPYCYVQTFNNYFDASKYSKMCIEGTYNGVTTTVSRDISDLTGNLYAMIIYLQNTTTTGWVALGVASQKNNFSTGATYRDVEHGGKLTGTMYVNKVWLE